MLLPVSAGAGSVVRDPFDSVELSDSENHIFNIRHYISNLNLIFGIIRFSISYIQPEVS
jgi:hypothetical protein